MLKVILETCLLTEDEIVKACAASKNAGADFVKTSTGFSSGGAKAADVALMKKSAGGLKVKASGGIHSYEEAMEMIKAVLTVSAPAQASPLSADWRDKHETGKAAVLAAGKGTRLQSEQNHMPKVMRMATGHPLLHYVLDALNFLPKDDTVIVAGYLREEVMKAFPDYPYAVQDPQQGTGHAGSAPGDISRILTAPFWYAADMPLIRRETYESLLRAHAENGCTCTFLTGN